MNTTRRRLRPGGRERQDLSSLRAAAKNEADARADGEKVIALGLAATILEAKRAAVGFGAAVAFGCVALVVFRDEWLSLDRALLSAAIICLGCAPAALYLVTEPARRPPVPLMALCGLFYAAFFGLPAFLTSNLTSQYGPERVYYEFTVIEAINRESQFLVIAGLALMFGAWIVGKRLAFARLPALRFGRAADAGSGATQGFPSPLALGLATLLALANLLYCAVPALRGLPSIGQFLQPAGYVAFALFYLLKAEGRLPRLLTFVYFGAIMPLWIAALAITGLLTPAILLVCLWLSLRMHALGAIPWKSALAVMVVFLWIYPHMSEYRANYWRLEKDKPAIEKLVGFGRLIAERTLSEGWGSTFASKRPFQRVVQRLSLNIQFSVVVDKSPDPIPHWQGATYRALFLGWVPRIVWKDKPEERWGNEFGRRYQFLAPENDYMSVNLPWLVELYANFGIKGVVLGMALIGLFLAFLERLLNRSESDIVGKAVGAAVLLPLFYQESNFTVMTGSLLPLIVCLWLYFNVPARLLAGRGNGA